MELSELTTEELLEMMPPRNKYWEITDRWSNDWWLQINQSNAGVYGTVNKFGRPQNTWYSDYVDDNDRPIRNNPVHFSTLKESLIDLLEYLKEKNIYDYRIKWIQGFR